MILLSLYLNRGKSEIVFFSPLINQIIPLLTKNELRPTSLPKNVQINILLTTA